MNAVEVYLNRMKVCTAGVHNEGICHANLILANLTTPQGERIDEVNFHVGGMRHTSDGGDEHVDWASKYNKLTIGDEITIRVIETDNVDEPEHSVRKPTGRTPYTPGIREVFKLSKAEAKRLGHDYVGPEHYLLGVIRKGDGLAIETLLNLDVDLEVLKLALERIVDVGKAPTVGLYFPNSDAKRVLETGKSIALEMKHGWVGTEHLLLSLLREENTLAHKCLNQFGLDYQKTFKEVIQAIEGSNTSQKQDSFSVIVSQDEIEAVLLKENEFGVKISDVLRTALDDVDIWRNAANNRHDGFSV